jgi:GDP-mannose 6-dehydrogenase
MGCLAQNGHHMIGVDVNETKVNLINSGKPTIIEKDIDKIINEQHSKGHIEASLDYKYAIQHTDISIVAVGTPSSSKGHLSLDYIFNVADHFAESLPLKSSFHIIAIRSTILPGTCDKFAAAIESKSNKKRNVDFAVVDNPEFLREGTAVHDYYHPPLTLIGSDNREASEKVAELYRELPGEIVITDLKVAEIMKYVNNTYHALKISFANEVGNICKAIGIDSHEVMDIFCKDRQLNISSYYFRPGFAYGGSCLPKDLKALQTLAHDQYISVPVIENIDKTNVIQINRAVEYLQQYKNERIGFLGISFKAGTDDLRNSPAVTLIELLLGKGFDITIYDRNVELSRLTGTNKDYIDKRIPHLSRLMSGDLQQVIAHSEVIVISTKEQEFSAALSKVVNKPIIDLVYLGKGFTEKENYYGMNW